MSGVNLKVSVSGVRGIVGESLTPLLIADFAAAFGEYIGGGRVVVGRDTRPSGRMYEHAVVAGLLSVGCQPVLLGIVPTPTVQIMVDELKANGGVVITASHNPAPWNALKFVGANSLFLDAAEAAELLDIYNQRDRAFVEEDDLRGTRHEHDAFAVHQRRLYALLDCARLRAARFKVAIDCCNGVGAYFSRGFLEGLGCEVVTLFDETDGVFRRTPEPVAANLSALGDTVRAHGCVVGFAQDPDGDRLAIVNAQGHPIGEQATVVLGADHVLACSPGPVVVNVQTTRALTDVARAHGCVVHYAPVGEINVANMMLAMGAVIGGEGGSGGLIWPAFHACRDSHVGMALVLEMMAVRNQTLDQILAGIPQYCTARARVPCSAARAVHVVRALTRAHTQARATLIDGLRLDWDDAWVLVRGSNTEPIMRVFAEATTQQRADELVRQFAHEITD
jgi:phosphomannomutase